MKFSRVRTSTEEDLGISDLLYNDTDNHQADMSEDMIMSRRPPLHTCAASFLAIIHTACGKAQENNGALGILAKGISKPMSIALPLVYAIQYQWLEILHFTDDWMLEFEKLAETIFPPLTILFDKIDMIVSTVEIIPEKFDDALNNRPPVSLHRASFLEWAFMRIIWGLDLNRKEEEKEIMMDMNSSSVTESSSSAAKDANCPAGQEEPLPEAGEKTERLSAKDKHIVEFSAIDESGEPVSSAPLDDDDDDSCKESAGDVRGKSKTKTSGEKIEKNTGEKQRKEAKDPVLELFESKWLI